MMSPNLFHVSKSLLFSLVFFILVHVSHAQTWSQIGSKVSGDGFQHRMGFSVCSSADGSIFISGASFSDANGDRSGLARVFQNQSGNWIQIGQDLVGETAGDFFGYSTAISSDGTIIAIGGPSSSDTPDSKGSVRVYQYQSNTWVQLGSTIEGDLPEDQMGYSVSLNGSGDILAVGANFHDDAGVDKTGQVKVFQWTSGSWNQLGSTLTGGNEGDILGTSIALNEDGTRLVAAGTNSNSGPGSDGHAAIFEFSGGSWNQLGSTLYGSSSNEGFGRSLSLNAIGDVVAIGAANNNDSFLTGGRVAIFQFDGTGWNQMGNSIYGTQNFDLTGVSVDINSLGNIVAIGGSGNSIVGPFAGYVRVFYNDSGTWTQVGDHILAESFDDSCGSSVSMNAEGDQIVIGSAGGYNSGDRSGHVRVFEADLSTLSIIEPPAETHYINIYPNPILNRFSLKTSKEIQEVMLFDTTGRLVKMIDSEELNENSIDISSLKSGVYIVEYRIEKRKVRQKVIKR